MQLEKMWHGVGWGATSSAVIRTWSVSNMVLSDEGFRSLNEILSLGYFFVWLEGLYFHYVRTVSF